uniref:DYW domain-containing protein n=1 Tax=Populus trichocarpa TaxID=3694 RepID=A0A2K2A1D2_POPTR
MKLKLIFLEIRKDSGGKGNTRFVLHDLDQEAKEKALFSHSERIAIVNGPTNTPPGTTLRIVRNLRICGDFYNLIEGDTKIKRNILERIIF